MRNKIFIDKGEIVKAFPIQVGDIYTAPNTEMAIDAMQHLHKYGIETKLYSYWNGHILKSYEIIYINKEGDYYNGNSQSSISLQ